MYNDDNGFIYIRSCSKVVWYYKLLTYLILYFNDNYAS